MRKEFVQQVVVHTLVLMPMTSTETRLSAGPEPSAGGLRRISSSNGF